MRQSISIFIFAALVFIPQSQQMNIHSLKKYGSIKIDKSSDTEKISLDVSDFDPGDKIYLKITYDIKIKELIIYSKFSNTQGDIYPHSYNLGIKYPFTFKKLSTSDFYYTIEKLQNYHYLNLVSSYEGTYKLKNTKIDEGVLQFVIILLLIIIGGGVVIGLVVSLMIKKCCINKIRELKNNLMREQANAQIQQPAVLVSVKNDEQQRVETNQNEARLSLNNKINKNDINIIPTIQNTENEIIPSNENFQEKK